ncbi:hypothetical protein ACFLU3_00440 [Chloroflexota bacterium]
MIDSNGMPVTVTEDDIIEFLCDQLRTILSAFWDVAQEEGWPFDIDQKFEQTRDLLVSRLKQDQTTTDDAISELNKSFAQVDGPNEFIDHHWQSIEEAFGQIKRDGSIPAETNAAETIGTLMFQPSPKTIRPNHPILLALEVSNESEWNDLPSSHQLVQLLRICSEEPKKRSFFRSRHSLVTGWAEDTSHESISKTRTRSLAEDKNNAGPLQVGDPKAQQTVEEQFYTYGSHDNERLLDFAVLAGFDLNEFTPKEIELMAETLDLLDTTVDPSSKKGISFKDYYGAKANSKKTQRHRLFEKVRTLSDNPQLK